MARNMTRRMGVITDLRQACRDLLEREQINVAAAAISTAGLAEIVVKLEKLVELADEYDSEDHEAMYPRNCEDGEGIELPSYTS